MAKPGRIAALALAIGIGLGALLVFSPGTSVDMEGADRYRVALLYLADYPGDSRALSGIVEGFRRAGLEEGRNMELRIFAPGGDLRSAERMAERMARDGYDLLLTLGEGALKMVARHNSGRRNVHVFAGIEKMPLLPGGRKVFTDWNHPSWMAGFVSPGACLELAMVMRRLNPDLKRVGVLFRSADESSGKIDELRSTMSGLGLEMITARTDKDKSGAVAATGLLSAGVGAVMVLEDAVAGAALEEIAASALSSAVPVFSMSKGDAARGALLSCSPDYFQTGFIQASLAVEILAGMGVSSIPIGSVSPVLFEFNDKLLPRLEGKWRIPSDVRNRLARYYVNGNHERGPGRGAADFIAGLKAGERRLKKLSFINYNESATIEENMNGFLSQMERMGYRAGDNYILDVSNAEGGVERMAELLRGADDSDSDVILVTTTPGLQTALREVKRLPLVFAVVADPLSAGIAEKNSGNGPGVAGVSSMSDFERMARMLKLAMPGVKRAGTLFNPEEMNSRVYCELLKQALSREGVDLVEVANSSRDGVFMATRRLMGYGSNIK